MLPTLFLRGTLVDLELACCNGDLASFALYLGGRLLCVAAGIPEVLSWSIPTDEEGEGFSLFQDCF